MARYTTGNTHRFQKGPVYTIKPTIIIVENVKNRVTSSGQSPVSERHCHRKNGSHPVVFLMPIALCRNVSKYNLNTRILKRAIATQKVILLK
ncbi:hypothetical protein I5Q83_31745 [Enterocloster clostridioformis]|nr:hypothetical protein [Enterocloster clostridioformis]QQR00309.1 hypothetical protein I5Q83_31745 [Enterocloster clostridioformis]